MTMTCRLSALFVLLGCVLCFRGMQAFEVLRGEDQLPMDELKLSNYFNLIDLAVKTKEVVTVELLNDTQMIIVQHGAQIILDCSPLMPTTGRALNPAMEWEETRLTTGSDGLLTPFVRPTTFTSFHANRIRTTGPLNRYLNITFANVLERGQVADNGIYFCSACSTTGCRTAGITIFMLGSLFEMVRGQENDAPLDNRRFDRIYDVGTNFCVEEGSTETIQLRCGAISQEPAIPFPFPHPSRSWTQNATLVYSVPVIGITPNSFLNKEFFTDSILRMPATNPPAFQMFNDGSLVMSLKAAELFRPHLAPNSSPETVQADVVEALLGSWTCTLTSDLQTETATTVISRC